MLKQFTTWLRSWAYQFRAYYQGRTKPHGKAYAHREAWMMGACGRFVIYGQIYGGKCPVTGKYYPGIGESDEHRRNAGHTRGRRTTNEQGD